MKGSIPLGRLAGVKLSAHWSLFVVLALVALALGTGILPAAAPGMPAVWYTVAGVLGAVAFVVTIVLHEMGHAVVAQRQGLPVDGMVVWALGGLTSIEKEPATPAAELALSGVGPLVSLVIGGVLVGVAWGLAAVAVSPVLVDTVGWLGGLNLLLAALNALPAAPLDGGRMLHAIAWKVTGDTRRSTLLSTGAGQVLGWVAVVAGLWMVLGGSTEGLWIGATGMFVAVGAVAQRQQAAAHAVLGERTVAQLMVPLASRPVPDWWTVDAALAAGLADGPGQVLVLHDWQGRLSGMASAVALLEVPYLWRRSVQLRQLAWPEQAVVTTTPSEPVLDLVRRWPPSAKWAVALVAGRPVGALSMADMEMAVSRWIDGSRGQPSWPVPPQPHSGTGVPQTPVGGGIGR